MVAVATATGPAATPRSGSATATDEVARPAPYGTSTASAGHGERRTADNANEPATPATNAAGTRWRTDGTVRC